MRTAFIDQFAIEARANPKLFLVVGDLGYSVIEPFARDFPDRFLNAGVAEQNMTGVAAGLASEGFHVFTYSIANFPTFRCAEFIRNDVAYHRQPVTIVSVGGGVAYGNLGYSHHAIQDFALIRSFPGMLIAAPADPMETRAVVKYLVANPRPSYLRLGKAGEPNVRRGEPIGISPGRCVIATPDSECDQAIITTGATLGIALEAWQRLPRKSWSVHSVPLWGPGEKEVIASDLRRFRHVVTVEEHLDDGGFGSFVREVVGFYNLATRIRSVALRSSVCGEVGSQRLLTQEHGLTCNAVVESALAF